MYANAWNWRPMLELIEKVGIIERERLELLGANLGQRVEESEACAIAKILKEELLPRMRPGDRMLLDTSITDQPDDGKMHYDYIALNYSSTYDWLSQFADFCANCKGFTVW